MLVFTDMSPMELTKRHGGHHYANVKYGYIVLLAILMYLAFIYISKRIYLTKWTSTGRSTTWRRLVSTPKVVTFLMWCVFLVVLAFWHFEVEEINVFIKRLGRLATTLLPLDIFISLKPNPLPDVYYQELIFLHKWISRVIVLLALIHGIMFQIVWIKAGTFSKVFKLLNFLGVIAMVLFLLSTIISLRPLRRRFYNWFFTGHLIIAWICVALLQFHTRPGVTVYTLINISLFILQIALKVCKCKDVKVERKTSPGSTLDLILLPNEFQNRFTAGSHIRLSYPRSHLLNYLLPSHPYTVASSPNDSTIKLILRRTTYQMKSGQIVSCFGPFASIPKAFFQTVENVILVAGGSGISFALGLYLQLTANPSINVSLIWVLRNKADLWILDQFEVRKVDVYLTGGAFSEDDPVSQVFDDERDELLEQRDSFEMEELDPFEDRDGSSKPSRSVKLGRPNFASYSAQLDKGDKANNWIVSCGTTSLNKDCYKWAKSQNVRHHSETYEI